MTSEGEAVHCKKKNAVHSKTSETPKQPVPAHIRTGRILFSRCRGQPFHISRILLVDTIRLRCYVRFEDGTTHWCRFNNIQNLGSNISTCCLCHEAFTSSTSSCIVSCFQCKLAFHSECHNPPIAVEQLDASRKWLCRVCIFSDTSVINGLPRKTENASASCQKNASSNSAKREILDWDNKHRMNKQNIYCYCQKPGRWSESMLQCLKCLQWFHYACISTLKTKPMSGDAMFVFVCSTCMSTGSEYLRRIQIKWLHIVQLALYRLEREKNTAERKQNVLFFDVMKDILPWMQKNWKRLLPGRLKGYPRVKRENRVIAVLKNHPKKFLKCSQKDHVLWRLKKDRPPSPPKIWLPDNGTPLTTMFLDRVLLEMGIKCSELGRSNEKQFIKDSGGSFQSIPVGLEKNGANVDTNCFIAGSSAASCAQISRKPNHVTTATNHGTDSQTVPSTFNSRNDRHLLTYHVVNGFTDFQESEPSSPSVCLQDSDSGRAKVSSNTASRLTAFKSNSKLRRNHLIGKSQISHYGRTSVTKSPADLLHMERVSSGREHFKIFGQVAKADDIAKALKHPQNVVDKEVIDEISNCEVSLAQLKSSVSQYFGAASRLARGERCRILGRRTTSDGLLQYHVEWENGTT